MSFTLLNKLESFDKDQLVMVAFVSRTKQMGLAILAITVLF